MRREIEVLSSEKAALQEQDKADGREDTLAVEYASMYASIDYEKIVKIVPGPSEETNDELSKGDIENGMVQIEPNSPDLR